MTQVNLEIRKMEDYLMSDKRIIGIDQGAKKVDIEEIIKAEGAKKYYEWLEN